MAPPPNTVIQNQEFYSETIGKNKTCFIHYMKFVHVLLYNNFVRYFVMMSQKFGTKICYDNR